MTYKPKYADWTRKEKAERKAAALEVTSGERGADGLTTNERALLETIRRLGDKIAAGMLTSEETR